MIIYYDNWNAEKTIAAPAGRWSREFLFVVQRFSVGGRWSTQRFSAVSARKDRPQISKDWAECREYRTAREDSVENMDVAENPPVPNAAPSSTIRDSTDEDGANDDDANLPLWQDLLGKTFEWRQSRFLNSEWRTIELSPNGKCVMREGLKRETKRTSEYEWQICDNSDFWGTKKGHLAIVPKRNGKPFRYFSRKAFEKAYPSELDSKLH